MVKFVNKTSNTEMWVADERKEEYLKAGHKLASALPNAIKPTEPQANEEVAEAEGYKKSRKRKK